MASTIKVNNIQNQCGANIINESANTITIGASGDTISLAAGASQTGFGRTGTVDWDTTAKTASFTAVSGTGYFVNTTSGAITVTLPAGSAGDIVGISDYASTFQTNNVTITPNGTDKINGENDNATLSTQGIAVSLVYVDATRGWKSVTGSDNDTTGIPPFIVATGGTITTCGNCKIHTFTGPGTFCVSNVAICAANNQVSYIVVAGGGSGGRGSSNGAGAGAGGFREDKSPVTPYTASPLEGAGAITVTQAAFPITVGAGGATTTSTGQGNDGSNSVFSTITSSGGGGGGIYPAGAGRSGGSGGGGGDTQPAGSGNTPPVSPPQGNPGGISSPNFGGQAGGGGATAAGVNGSGPGGAGGAGATSSITGSPVTRAGGGGGGAIGGTAGSGGSGGGGNGSSTNAPGGAGSTNTGGGGGGNGPINGLGGAGGSGIVIIRYKYQ